MALTPKDQREQDGERDRLRYHGLGEGPVKHHHEDGRVRHQEIRIGAVHGWRVGPQIGTARLTLRDTGPSVYNALSSFLLT